MLVYERDEHPVYIEFLLHYSPYLGRVGIFAYSVFAVIVGFNVKGHRTTPPLAEISETWKFRQIVINNPKVEKLYLRSPLSTLVFPPGLY
jgi:hypothetical protein